MRFTRSQSAALVQIHPYDCRRIERPTSKTMLAEAFSWRAFVFFAALVAFTVGFAPRATAQGITTGSISGTVVDPTGAVIPGATINATATATDVKATAVAGKLGEFRFKDVPIGKYTLVITATGFSGLTLNNIEVDAAKEQGLGAEVLSPGSASTVVEVSAAQNIIETTQSQVTTTFDTQALTNLPTAGGFDELALLIPGVVDTHSDGFSNTNGANFSVNGERGRGNNFEIDGQANNDTTITGPSAFFGNDEAG